MVDSAALVLTSSSCSSNTSICTCTVTCTLLVCAGVCVKMVLCLHTCTRAHVRACVMDKGMTALGIAFMLWALSICFGHYQAKIQGHYMCLDVAEE